MRILFCGARTAGYDCLKYLLENKETIAGVLTVDDTKEEKWAKSVLELANSKELKTLVPSNTRDPALIESIKKLEPDTLLSVYYDKIIPPEILNLCKWRINFHGGKLPEYRGSFSNIWAIINEEKKTAATAHIMQEKVDSGDIVGVREADISDEDTGKSLYFKISDAATELFKEVYTKLKKGALEPTPQPKEGRRYPRQLPYKGLIDWGWPQNRIHNFIRALNFPPFTPARTVIGGKEAYVYCSKLEGGYLVLTDLRFKKKAAAEK